MNLEIPGAIFPLCCALLSTIAKTVGGCCNPPFGELGLRHSRMTPFLYYLQTQKVIQYIRLLAHIYHAFHFHEHIFLFSDCLQNLSSGLLFGIFSTFSLCYKNKQTFKQTNKPTRKQTNNQSNKQINKKETINQSIIQTNNQTNKQRTNERTNEQTNE